MTPAINETDICSNFISSKDYNVFYLMVMSVLVLCNAILLAGIGANWSTLRHNIVYRYLISCLLSAICFCVAATYEILHTQNHVYSKKVERGVLQSYSQTDATHREIMHDWSYRKGLLVCLLLVMELNIAVLIYAVGDNTHFFGRYSDVNFESTEKKRITGQETKTRRIWRRLLTDKRSKVVTLTTSAWVIPIILSIPTAFQWNCVNECLCLPATRNEPFCLSGNGTICSRRWQPMSQSFFIVIALLYVTAIVFMFTMLVKVSRKFYRTYAPRSSGAKMEAKRNNIEVEVRRSNRTNVCSSRSSDHSETLSGTPVQQSSSAQKMGEKRNRTQSTISNESFGETEKPPSSSFPGIVRSARPPLHDTIKLLIGLTFSIFLSVSPMIIIYLYDVLDPSEPQAINGIAFDVSVVLTFVHAASQPVILLMYMRGLRKSCVNMLLKLPCLRTTEVVKRRPRTTTRLALFHNLGPKKRNAPSANTSLRGKQAVKSESSTALIGIEKFAHNVANTIVTEIISESKPVELA